MSRASAAGRLAGARGRGLLAAVGASIAAFALLFAAAGVGIRSASLSATGGWPSLAESTPRERPDLEGRLSPVSGELVAQVFGSEGLAAILRGGDGAADRAVPGGSTPRRSTRTGPTPDVPADPPGQDGTVLSSPGRGGSLAPGDWALAFRAEVDRDHARAGDEITYRFIFTNIGGERFRGSYAVTAHLPFGTVTNAPTCVGVFGGTELEREVCTPVPTPVPGVGTTDAIDLHRFTAEGSARLDPGESFLVQLTVEVEPWAQPGTDLENHGHLDVLGDSQGSVDSNPVKTRVDESEFGSEPAP